MAARAGSTPLRLYRNDKPLSATVAAVPSSNGADPYRGLHLVPLESSALSKVRAVPTNFLVRMLQGCRRLLFGSS